MKHIRTCKGLTLVEMVLAVVILAVMISGMSGLYFSGLQSLDQENDRMLLDSRLRGRMEQLIGTAYGALSDGSDVVAVGGQNYTVNWTIAPIDLNGDATPEPNAVQLTVSVSGVPGASLTTILVDHEGKVGKI